MRSHSMSGVICWRQGNRTDYFPLLQEHENIYFYGIGFTCFGSKKLLSQFAWDTGSEWKRQRVKWCFSKYVIPQDYRNQDFQMQSPPTNSRKKCPNSLTDRANGSLSTPACWPQLYAGVPLAPVMQRRVPRWLTDGVKSLSWSAP